MKRMAYGLLAFGLVGILTLGILASVIPAPRMVAVMNAVMEVPVPVDSQGVQAPSPAPMQFYTTVWGRGHLTAFLQTFHLTWLFVLCCLAVAAGGWMLYRVKLEEKRMRAHVSEDDHRQEEI